MRKILFCAVDVGGRIGQYSKILQRLHGSSVKCESFVKYAVSQKHFENQYTRVYQFREKSSLLQWWLSLRHFLWALFRFKVIYIISGENILTHKLLGLELWTYKLFGKKVVMHFVGSDIRNTNYLIWKNFHAAGKTSEPAPPLQSPLQIKRCQLAEKYASKILVSTPDLLQFFSHGRAIHIPVFLDLVPEGRETSERKDTTVLFAPSHVHIKGADVISPLLAKLSGMDRIKVVDTTMMDTPDKPDMQYKLTRYELLDLYQQADVIVDQVIIGWYGLQAVEALAHGLLPVVRVDQKLVSHLPEDYPMITFSDIESLEVALKEAIGKIQSGVWNKATGKAWVEKYHNAETSTELDALLNWMAVG